MYVLHPDKGIGGPDPSPSLKLVQLKDVFPQKVLALFPAKSYLRTIIAIQNKSTQVSDIIQV